MNTEYTREHLETEISETLLRYFGVSDKEEATTEQIYFSLLLTVKEILSTNRGMFSRRIKNGNRKEYTICAWNF